MAYTRKTVDRWDIETNYGYGWEVENSEYTKNDAMRSYKEYVENLGPKCGVRVMKRRERAE